MILSSLFEMFVICKFVIFSLHCKNINKRTWTCCSHFTSTIQMASLVASTVEDQDLDTRKELNKLFANKFSVQIEKSANDYILFIAQNKSQLVAAGLSGRPAVVLYDAASGLRETGTISE